ncbi:MAG: glycosyltransferase [Chitinophagaceae bacterium]
MKIVFLCGSLEPGCDGVGDYIRRLAGELVRQGHHASAIALNDRHLKAQFTGTQHIEGVNFQVLRVPSVWPERSRFHRAKEWINEIQPEWLSLQYVPFAFHLKGLPFRLGGLLLNLAKEVRWHIMFHELWVGMDTKSTKKHILWGMVQRRLIKSLISKLHPHVVQTQTRLYQAQLAKLGVKAEYLPLFANIPNIRQMNTKSTTTRSSADKNIISLVLFGTIHPGAPVDELATEVALYARKKGLQIYLTIIGRCGTEQEHWTAVWQSAGLVVEVLGEQQPERISNVLGNASIGLSTTPIALVEKSGAAAAMLEHGLPVLCVRDPWEARGLKSLNPHPAIFEYRNGHLEEYLAYKRQDFSLGSTVSEVSRQLENTLMKTIRAT